jgi:hypothetical protein
MSSDPKGFEENPQMPLTADDDQENVIDESIFGPQKVLTPEEQADYDAWFRRKVGAALEYSRRPDAVFVPHDEVMARAEALLKRLDREADIRED